MKPAPLHVLVVDDSAVVRQAFTRLFGDQFSIETAGDPLIASGKMSRRRPSVVVLDLQMPRMNGLTFLRQIMSDDPLPVVICSAEAPRGSDAAIRALEEGAVDIIVKPQFGVREFIAESALILADVLRAAAGARVKRRDSLRVTQSITADAVLPPVAPRAPRDAPRVIAVGASTGGPEALRMLIEALPADAPPVLVVQHMPAAFTGAFARRLDASARVEVKEAASGDAVTRGRVLLAPGNRHMLLRRAAQSYFVELVDGTLVSRHRPSVDVLFRSVAQAAGANGVGVILTGMGADGAAGMREMKLAGALTIAQDETTCVVFGMPKEAIARGGVDLVLPLRAIAPQIVH